MSEPEEIAELEQELRSRLKGKGASLCLIYELGGSREWELEFCPDDGTGAHTFKAPSLYGVLLALRDNL